MIHDPRPNLPPVHLEKGACWTRNRAFTLYEENLVMGDGRDECTILYYSMINKVCFHLFFLYSMSIATAFAYRILFILYIMSSLFVLLFSRSPHKLNFFFVQNNLSLKNIILNNTTYLLLVATSSSGIKEDIIIPFIH